MLDPTLCREHGRQTERCACCTLYYCPEFYEAGICPGCQQHRRTHPGEECGGAKYRAEAEADPDVQRYREAIRKLSSS